MNNRSFYTILTIFFLLLILGPGTVSAYYLSLDAPSEVRVGQPFSVNGTTNIPPPDKIDIVLSFSSNIPIEKERKSIEITEKGDNSFNATFDTTGYEKGNYKVEALSQTMRDFSAGSRNLRVVKLTDRSDIIRFSSPLFQDFTGTLEIETRIQGYEDNAIRIEVKKDNTTIFGPESVPVNRGLMKYDLPIKEPGSYSITFYDSEGYIGSYPVQVGEETKSPQVTPEPTESQAPESHETSSSTPPTNTPVPTKIHDSLPDTSGPVASQTIVSPAPTKSSENITKTAPVLTGGVSATTQVSRDSPAYFMVSVKQVPVTISTSTEDDWVLEYKTSMNSAGVKVNDKGKGSAEQVTITDNVSEIYLKVNPYSYKSAGDVTITATNAISVDLSDKSAQAFGAPPRYGSSNTSSTPTKSPAPLAAVIIGFIGAALIIRRR